MASGPRGEADEGVPTSFPETTPKVFAQPSQDFLLRAIMEMQRTLGELSSKVDRVVTDGKSHGEKLDAIRTQISFVRGVLWVLGGLMALAIAGGTAYLRFLPKS
jgi:hypothetical protein